MKVFLPVILTGAGGIGTIALVYGGFSNHRPEVEESREESDKVDGLTENNNSDDKTDHEFEKLKQEVEEFANKCKSDGKVNGKTVLDELKDIFKTLLEPQNQDHDSFLNSKKSTFERYLEKEEDKVEKKESFEKLYTKLENFSKPLRNDQEKFFKYKEKLISTSYLSSVL